MSGRAVVPILGALALFLGSSGAFYIDYLEQKKHEQEIAKKKNRSPSTVLFRYLSLVIEDVYSPASRSFLIGITIFAICFPITAHWQGDVKESETIGTELLVYATISGVSGFLMAIGAYLYRVNQTVGTVVHVLLATLFQYGFIAYGFESFNIDDYWKSERQVLVFLACGAAGVCALTAGIAVPKGIQLDFYYKTLEANDEEISVDELSEHDVWMCRVWVFVLGGSQMIIGFAMSLLLAIAADQV